MKKQPLTYGVADPDTVASMSGREFLQAMINGRVPQAAISEALTFRITEAGEGFAVFEGDPGTHLLNPVGMVHGGWALTMIDSATGCACLSLLPAGKMFTTVETKVNFSRPILKDTGSVIIRAEVISQGNRIVSTIANARSKETGKILAHGTSTLFVL